MRRGNTSIAEWGYPKECLMKPKKKKPDYYVDGMHPVLAAYTSGRIRASAVDLLHFLQKLEVVR